MILWFSVLPVPLKATTSSSSSQLFFISWKCIENKQAWYCHVKTSGTWLLLRLSFISQYTPLIQVIIASQKFWCGMERPFHTVPQISLLYRYFYFPVQLQALTPLCSFPLHSAVRRVSQPPSFKITTTDTKTQVKQHCPLWELVNRGVRLCW